MRYDRRVTSSVRRIARANGTPITTAERYINVAVKMDVCAIFLKGSDAVKLLGRFKFTFPFVMMNTARRASRDVTSLEGSATTLGAERFAFIRYRVVDKRLGFTIYRGTALLLFYTFFRFFCYAPFFLWFSSLDLCVLPVRPACCHTLQRRRIPF